ncbi:MAG: ATP-binding cassette domain-containing protein, partial [Nitrospina sp.]|nr:ATP-binding cassette domain-containing protein [Nitrospina sp.]
MIEFKNFTAAFGERKVVQGLTLNLPANSITALIGASGSGKTTLLRVLCRMN